MSTVFSPVRRAWHGIFDYDDIKNENDQLRQQVEQQEGASIEAEAQIRELEELRAIEQPAGAVRHPHGGRRGRR